MSQQFLCSTCKGKSDGRMGIRVDFDDWSGQRPDPEDWPVCDKCHAHFWEWSETKEGRRISWPDLPERRVEHPF